MDGEFVTYVAFWERSGPGAPEDGLARASLARMSKPAVSQTAETHTRSAGLWTQWEGIDLAVHGCINVQFNRAYFNCGRQQ